VKSRSKLVVNAAPRRCPPSEPSKSWRAERLLRDAKRTGKLRVRFGSLGLGRPIISKGGARMRIVFLIGMLMACSGCAADRSVTFLYYPAAPNNGIFPREYQFEAEAQKECARYGMYAVPNWVTVADFGRVRAIYNCVNR
jgi:hypothetical protein